RVTGGCVRSPSCDPFSSWGRRTSYPGVDPMTAFAYELASVLQHAERARPGQGAYALPWYLVIGEPHSGRSPAIKALTRRWPLGDAPLPVATPQQFCSYWLPEKALFIEPAARVL